MLPSWYEVRKATHCSAPQLLSFKTQTGFAVFGGFSISSPFVWCLSVASALDSPCPAEAATAHATRAQRAHRLLTSEACICEAVVAFTPWLRQQVSAVVKGSSSFGNACWATAGRTFTRLASSSGMPWRRSVLLKKPGKNMPETTPIQPGSDRRCH